MKISKFKEELKQLSVKELLLKLETLRRDQFGLRLNATTSHVKDYSQFGKGRANIACVLNALRLKGAQ
jgi:ribosomal protein L29